MALILRSFFRPKSNTGESPMTLIGCDFTVKFAQTGYQAAEPVVKWLESGHRQIHHIEANDSKSYAASFPLWPEFLEAWLALTSLTTIGVSILASKPMVCTNHTSSDWSLVVSRAKSEIKRLFDWFLFLRNALVHLLHTYADFFLRGAVLMQVGSVVGSLRLQDPSFQLREKSWDDFDALIRT